MSDAQLAPKQAAHTLLSSRRAIVSVFMVILCGSVFFFLPYKIHESIWSRLAPDDLLFEKNGFPIATSAMAAIVFGAAGLCADPFLERLCAGRGEYLRKYGPPISGFNYPWEIQRVKYFFSIIAPIMTFSLVWYMFDGYEISDRIIKVRQGPFDSFRQIHWDQVNSIDVFCFKSRHSGFLERFSINTAFNDIDLGHIVFDEYGNSVTSEARGIERIMTVNHIYNINAEISPGCHSPDITEILSLTNAKRSDQSLF